MTVYKTARSKHENTVHFTRCLAFRSVGSTGTAVPAVDHGHEREGMHLSALRLTAYMIESIGEPTLVSG